MYTHTCSFFPQILIFKQFFAALIIIKLIYSNGTKIKILKLITYKLFLIPSWNYIRCRSYLNIEKFFLEIRLIIPNCFYTRNTLNMRNLNPITKIYYPRCVHLINRIRRVTTVNINPAISVFLYLKNHLHCLQFKCCFKHKHVYWLILSYWICINTNYFKHNLPCLNNIIIFW